MKKLVLLLLIIFVVSSCALQGEICNTQGEVFLALKENHRNFFITLEDELPGSIFEASSGNLYPIIDSLSNQNELFIITNSEYGPSARRLGISGYYYSLNNEQPDLSEEYTQIYMDENIWCYQKK